MSESLAIFDSNPLLGIICYFIILFMMGFTMSLGLNCCDMFLKRLKSFLSVHFQRKNRAGSMH